MIGRPALDIFLLQVLWFQAQGWCLYPCPKSTLDESVCGVDSKLGAKLFPGKCLMWKANYCQKSDYHEIEMQQCLDQYPQVVDDFLVLNRCVSRYESLRQLWGVRPFRRYFLLFNLINRLGFRPLPPMPPWPGVSQPRMAMPPGWNPPSWLNPALFPRS
uniref:Kazal-like domain-containing protein n=1 Tax=Graphocephala atropunctata TaxID=36148 RepID=A0A1B6KIM7_9HEMI